MGYVKTGLDLGQAHFDPPELQETVEALDKVDGQPWDRLNSARFQRRPPFWL